jgi:type I restriction enzyme, S subunit
VILDPDDRTVVSTGFAVMSPSPIIGSSLLTTIAGSADFASYLESVAHGSAYPAVSIQAMGKYEVEIPTAPAVVAEFETTTMPLRRRAHQMDFENRKIAELRETLLPELLSGRIRVREAEDAVA